MRSAGIEQVSRLDKIDPTEPSKPVERWQLPQEVTDKISVSGVPEAELTPNVQAALTSLMAEVAALRRLVAEGRREVGQARELTEQLQRRADLHDLDPGADRRSFVRELSKAIAVSTRYGIHTSIAYFGISGLPKTGGTLVSAADAVLARIGRTLVENVREGDTVGRLGADAFGAILIQTDEPESAAKARALADLVRMPSARLRGSDNPIDVAFGVHTFKPGEDAEVVLAAANHAMQQMPSM